MEKVQSSKEIRAILEKYGITGMTDGGLTEEREHEADTVMRTEFLLMEAGFNNGLEWAPPANGVYAFDVEVFDEESMYRDFLMSISALGGEKLKFENIVDDTSGVDWENGEGNRLVSFDWDGQHYTIETMATNDWFDPQVAVALSEIVKEKDTGKRLYFHMDCCGQIVFVFYRDADWAEGFQRDTGLFLSDDPMDGGPDLDDSLF